MLNQERERLWEQTEGNIQHMRLRAKYIGRKKMGMKRKAA